VDRLRESELFDLVEKIAEMGGPTGAMAKMPWKSTEWQSFADSIEEAAFVMLPDEDAYAIVRTKDDMSLEGMVGLLAGVGSASGRYDAEENGEPEPQTHAGAEYVGFSDGFLAKTAGRTFLATDDEADLQAALDRLKGNEKAQLNDTLRRALDSARGDHFVAMLTPGGSVPGAPIPMSPGGMSAPKPEWFGIGFSTDSRISIDGTMGFSTADDASKIKQAFDEGVAKVDSMMDNAPPNAPPEMRQMMEKMVGMIRAIELSQSGDVVRVRGSWSIRDIEELIGQVGSMMPRGPGAGGMF
jgi:hypothetical protein